MNSNLPSVLHKASAFAVMALGSMAAWQWGNILDAHTAALVVTGLGAAKFVGEFLAGKAPVA